MEMPSSHLMIITINILMLRHATVTWFCISFHQTTSKESQTHEFGSVQPAVKSLAPGLRMVSHSVFRQKIRLRGHDVTIRVGVENAARTTCEGRVSWQGIWLKLWKIRKSHHIQRTSSEMTTLKLKVSQKLTQETIKPSISSIKIMNHPTHWKSPAIPSPGGSTSSSTSPGKSSPSSPSPPSHWTREGSERVGAISTASCSGVGSAASAWEAAQFAGESWHGGHGMGRKW